MSELKCYRCGEWPCECNDGIALIHGDCREASRQLTGFDLVFTDPPYKHKHLGGDGFGAAKQKYSAADSPLKKMSNFILADYADVLTNSAPMLIAFCSRDLIYDYAALSRNTGRTFDLHVWHKKNAIPFTSNTWKSDLEYITLSWQRKPGWKQFKQAMHSKLYSSACCRDKFHPTCKPLPLITKYLCILDAKNILDPFAGSGTTLVAAKQLGRRAIGIELEEKYCEIAAKRLANEPMPLPMMEQAA